MKTVYEETSILQVDPFDPDPIPGHLLFLVFVFNAQPSALMDSPENIPAYTVHRAHLTVKIVDGLFPVYTTLLRTAIRLDWQ